MASKGQTHGTKNLIPMSQRSQEERHRIAVMGGEAAKEAAKRRKTLKEWAQAIGSEEIRNKAGEQMSRDGVLILQQYNKALKGDTKAARFVAQVLGELVETNQPTTQITAENITLKIE